VVRFDRFSNHRDRFPGRRDSLVAAARRTPAYPYLYAARTIRFGEKSFPDDAASSFVLDHRFPGDSHFAGGSAVYRWREKVKKLLNRLLPCEDCLVLSFTSSPPAGIAFVDG
jgi:hypothetical protein